MSSNPKVAMAFSAMKAIGISEKKVKPVLKNLLKLYEKNWQLIEEENYRVLADAIFEYEENEVDEKKKEVQSGDDCRPPSKRLRSKHQEEQASPSGETSLKRLKGEEANKPQDCLANSLGEGKLSEPEGASPKVHLPGRNEELSSPQACSRDESEEPSQLHLRKKRSEPEPSSAHTKLRDKGKEPIVNCHSYEREQPGPLCIRDNRETFSISPRVHPINKRVDLGGVSSPACLKVPKAEPGVDPLPKELASFDQNNGLINPKTEPCTDDFPQIEVPIAVIHPPNPDPTRNKDPVHENRNIYNGKPDGVESLASQHADVEDKGQGGSGAARESGTSLELADIPEASHANVEIASSSSGEVVPQVPRVLALDGTNDFHGTDDLHGIIQPNEQVLGDTNGETDKRMEQQDPGSSSLSSFIAVLHKKYTHDDTRPLHDVNDISKGEESVRISLVNEVSSEPYPPLFFYIPRNIIFRNAYVKFSLSRIGDEDCCSNCFGDCMASSLPCACARETGGDFAYTLEGVLKENFLDECISMNHDPQQSCLSYCKNCPLERCKNVDVSEPCKGHIPRKFIKECWSKCGCNKQCGNRVVQRGITHNLQVFLTAEGKGWGLRTLEDLPRGTFVCEYIGEILTNVELYERNTQIVDAEKHTYPVLLDAAWGSEVVVKDKEALYLDATFYGNVARFINHRCFDANLIQIPVEVETPYHHYYHLAFFTTRNIDALEELTWDYGIDFDDHNRPVKAFGCRCGSKCCRDMKHSHS